jgi:hypothetical protein
MATRYSSLHLIRALVAKMLKVFHRLKLRQVYIKMYVLFNFSLIFLNLCLPIVLWISRGFVVFQLCILDCKRLYAIMCCGKPFVEVDGASSLWSSTISILEIGYSWTSSCFVTNNHGDLCVSYHWSMCNYDGNFWPMDVINKLWYFCFGCQSHQPRLNSLSHNNWII